MKLKIFHTGHAGFIVEFDNKILVCDHWSDSYRPFEGSWQKLEKDNFSDTIMKLLENPDYIWCSHEHGDHYDPTYITQHMKSDTKLIVPQFIDQSLYDRMIHDNIPADNILLLGDLQTLQLTPNFQVIMLFEEPAYSNHSSLIIRANDFHFMHNSDTTPNSHFYDKIKYLDIRQIDLFAGQYCNPTPYPWVVEMENIEKESEALEFHHSAIQSYCQMCKKLNVIASIPCAGPAIVPSFDISLFPAANKLIYDKEHNLSIIRSVLGSESVLNLISNQTLEFDV